MKQINTLCKKNAELLEVRAYSRHWATTVTNETN